MQAGTFDSRTLEIINLSDNQIQHAEAGAFGKQLKYIWVTGPRNNITCEGLQEQELLPQGVSCLDDAYCAATPGVDLGQLGNGVCDEDWDPAYNTAACFWDAGDCK